MLAEAIAVIRAGGFLVLLAVFFAASAHAGSDLLASQDAGMEGHWMAPHAAAEQNNPVPADSSSLLRGRELYRKHCAACHGSAGEGDGPAGAGLVPKPANLREMGKIHPPGDLAWKISHGRGPMPAWKDVLTEFEIWDLVNYIKGLHENRYGTDMGLEVFA